MLKRTKRRYVSLKIDSDARFNSQDLIDALWSSVTKLFGEYGASRTGLTLIDHDQSRNVAIIRVSLAALENVQATLASITKIGDTPAGIHVTTVSGTIRSLRKKAE